MGEPGKVGSIAIISCIRRHLHRTELRLVSGSKSETGQRGRQGGRVMKNDSRRSIVALSDGQHYREEEQYS